jgi:hypothetical protein
VSAFDARRRSEMLTEFYGTREWRTFSFLIGQNAKHENSGERIKNLYFNTKGHVFLLTTMVPVVSAGDRQW